MAREGGQQIMKYSGSCHCGAVLFEITGPARITAQDCNCSICSKSGFLHLILPKSSFRLIQGEESMTTYGFKTGVAKHTFCKVCGIKPFYTPRSNPDGVDVNDHCLDTPVEELIIESFDGKNWEANAQRLAHLSVDID
jgi:hypothetical protein